MQRQPRARGQRVLAGLAARVHAALHAALCLVKLEERSPDSSFPRIAEAAGGVSASIIRSLERGRTAG